MSRLRRRYGRCSPRGRAESYATAPIDSLSAPVLSGTVAVGNNLAIAPGLWQGVATLLYTLRRNGIAVGSLTGVTEAVIEAYVLTAADVGPVIDVLEYPAGRSDLAVDSNNLQTADIITITAATTRFYLHAAAAAPTGVAPTVDAAWTDTNELVRRSMTTAQDVDAIANGTQIDWTAGAVAVDRQYISPPIHAGTIAGSVKCYIRAAELQAGDNASQRLGIRVVSPDGATVRGTLLAVGFYGTAAELAGSSVLTNRAYANGDALSSVAALEGDRIVVELGYSDAAGSAPDAFASYGSTAASDLPEDETTATALRPWFQLTVS